MKLVKFSTNLGFRVVNLESVSQIIYSKNNIVFRYDKDYSVRCPFDKKQDAESALELVESVIGESNITTIKDN